MRQKLRQKTEAPAGLHRTTRNFSCSMTVARDRIHRRRVREDSQFINERKVQHTFEAIELMASGGVVSFNSLDDFSDGIGSVKGFSRELDVPLRVIEEAQR